MSAFVGVLLIHLYFPEAASLKDKRAELRSLKAHLQTSHGASVCEADHHDRWQRSTLVAALTAGSQGRAGDALDRVARALDARFVQGVVLERAVLSATELLEGFPRAGSGQ